MTAALLLLVLVSSGVSAQDYYELRGHVYRPNGHPFRMITPLVFLEGATTPFTARTWVNAAGEFKFEKLSAGMYTLVIVVPDRGEMRQSIDIGPSLADRKGIIKMIFHFRPNQPSAATQTVSVTQLSIPEKARREYERALERLQDYEVEKAVEYLKKAVKIAPHFAEAWNRLGTIAYQSRSYDQAEQYFREALDQDPQAYSPLVNLGGALLSQGKYQEALTINLRAVRAQPSDALAHSQLGHNYLMLGQLLLAEKHLRRAKNLDPRHFYMPRLVLAEVYRKRQDYESLIRELEEFLEIHPDSEYVPRLKKMLDEARNRHDR